MAPRKDGLIVTVKPSASAYFAGEEFSATITFTNSHPRPEPPAPLAPPPLLSHSRTASSINLTSWQTTTNSPASRNKPPNASHLGLAEYATSHLDSDQIPPSPYFGSTSGQFQPFSSGSSPARRNFTPPQQRVDYSPKRPSFGSSLSNPHNPTPSLSSRTISGSSPSSPTTTNSPSIPTRKGLIGKPPSSEDSSCSSNSISSRIGSSSGVGGGGLYASGPRRPGGGGLLRSGSHHGRSQSMAVSGTNLLARNPSGEGGFRSSSGGGVMNGGGGGGGGGHQKGRYGGSVVAGGGGGGNGFEELRRSTGPSHVRAPSTLQEESDQSTSEPPTPHHPDDAAFPISSSSSSPAPPSFPRRPTFGHQRIPSSSSVHRVYSGGNHRARLSTLSLADSDSSENDSEYDPNDESRELQVNGFYGVGKNDTMDSLVEGSLNASTSRRNGRNGPLFNSSTTDSHQPPQQEKKVQQQQQRQHPKNTIALLWAFAHLEGSFEVDEELIKPNEFLEVKQLLAGGVGGVGMGGGTLEPKKEEKGGWKSWLWGNSTDSTARSKGESEESRNGTREGEAMSGDTGGAASFEERKEKAVKDKTVPIFSCPASILGVDLVLEPGQSKNFSFSLRLPADLPPSFRGKAIKFNYQLVVGSNRVSLSSNPGMAQGKGSVSRLMRVPLRIYNHVGVTGARPFYDLTNPVIYQRDEATISTVEKDAKVAPARHPPRKSDVGRPEFEQFATNLISSISSISPDLPHHQQQNPPFPQLSASIGAGGSRNGGLKSIMDVRPEMRPEMSSHRGGGGGGSEAFGIDLDEQNGCKAAVEIVSRNSQKVSYDINKDGYLVAQLTLVKSAYRLGETVNGSVVINSGEGRVLRVSARLETHELVETSISTKPAAQTRSITRRLHSEHHEATLDTARLGFALAIPSGATPDFGTSGVKLQWSVRLSFLVIPPSPDAPALGSNPNLTPRRAPPPPSPLPPPSNGRSGHHGRSKSFAYGFEPAVPLTLPPAPSIAPSGAAHLMPLSTLIDPLRPAQYTSYRAVPDLGFVPVLFSSSLPDPPPSPGPLQKTAAGAMHRPNAPSMSLSQSQRGDPLGRGRTVLVPAKVETVECSIPIKVYPGNTPFKPTVTTFEA